MKQLAATALLALALAAPAAAETRDLSGFGSVYASGKLRVQVAIGDAYAVDVSGEDAGDVATWVNEGVLHISQRNTGWFSGGRRLDAIVRVTTPRIDSLRAQRGADLRANGEVASNELALSAIQGGALSVERLQAERLSLRASQGGAVSAAGVCGTVRANASMGGSLSASDVDCRHAYVSASMGGVANVHARETLEANASMGGAIDVSGHPAQNDTSSMMGGAISLN